jgi:D-alanyl-D-alanine carboxypeptidase
MAALQPQAATAAPSAGSARFEIQVGAYASVDEAQRSLNAVQAKTGTLLARYPSVTHPVAKAGRQVFRARFRGFDANSAAATCQKLRAQSFDCFVMSAE